MQRRAFLRLAGVAAFCSSTAPAFARGLIVDPSYRIWLEANGFVVNDSSLPVRAPVDSGTKPVVSPASAAVRATSESERRLHLVHPFSSESFSGVYWVNGSYREEALRQLQHLMRDRNRGGVELRIDPSLYDFLHDLNARIGNTEPMQVISGYRQPGRTRDRRDSLHVDGQAVDIRLPGRNLRQIGKVANTMKRGGVGFYSHNHHLHLDTGPVRTWG